MKKQIFLSLFLIAIVVITILIGCGGGNDGITQVTTVSTPTVQPSGYGSLTITVVWPQKQTASNELITSSSKDEKNLIASAPMATDKIIVNVYEADTYIDDKDYTKNKTPLGLYVFENVNPLGGEQKAVIEHIPAIKVVVRADAYGSIFGDEYKIYISHNYTTFQIQPGKDNKAPSIDLGYDNIEENVRYAVGDEINLCDAFITANLSVDFDYQSPTETPATAKIQTSDPLNALDSAAPAETLNRVPSPIPQGNRKVKFTVESVTYTGTDNVIVTPADIHVDPELTTDPNGNCTAMVKADKKPVKAMIKATLVGLDGQDTDISRTCDVDLLDSGFYFWTCVSPDLIPGKEKVLRKYDSNGNQLAAFIDIGDDPNQLRYPSSLAIDSSGNFYIAEIMKSTVKKFDSNGNYVNILYNGNVSDICVDSKDNVYVSVNPDNEIRKYDSNGTLLNSFKSEEEGMFQPNGIDCEFVLSGDNIYVLYSGNCLVKFDNNGNIIKNWYLNDGAYGDAIIVDKIRKYIYIACFYPENEIQKFDLVDEKFLTSFARGDTGGRHGVHLGVDQNGYVYKTSYDESYQTVIKKYSPDNNGEFIQQFSIPGCSQIIFVSQ